VLQRMVNASGMHTKVPPYEAYTKVRDFEDVVSPKRLEKAQRLYDEMVARGQS
jgi:hypothetical protein